MMRTIKIVTTVLLLALLASCEKYSEIGEATYPEQSIYFPAAVAGASANGIYAINSVAAPGTTFRYIADVTGGKLNIPLSVYRAGLDKNGSVSANITVNADTVNKFLALGRFPAGTELLSSSNYSVGNAVTIEDGKDVADFVLSVDLNFLLANTTKKYAIGLSLNSPGKSLGSSSVLIVLIDPAFLVPTANFTSSVSGRTVSFSNTSTNGVTYSWSYGDGSAPSTKTAAPYTYQAAGTYTVTLTATGVLGARNPSVKTATVTVQ